MSRLDAFGVGGDALRGRKCWTEAERKAGKKVEKKRVSWRQSATVSGSNNAVGLDYTANGRTLSSQQQFKFSMIELMANSSRSRSKKVSGMYKNQLMSFNPDFRKNMCCFPVLFGTCRGITALRLGARSKSCCMNFHTILPRLMMKLAVIIIILGFKYLELFERMH